MRTVASPLRRMQSRNKAAYQYQNESVIAFPEGQELVGILDKTGYTDTRLRPLTLGVCTIYQGAKILL